MEHYATVYGEAWNNSDIRSQNIVTAASAMIAPQIVKIDDDRKAIFEFCEAVLASLREAGYTRLNCQLYDYFFTMRRDVRLECLTVRNCHNIRLAWFEAGGYSNSENK